MTIDSNTTTGTPRKRPLERATHESPPNKRQKSSQSSSPEPEKQIQDEKSYSFQPIADALIRRCCQDEVEFKDRKSAFFTTYLESPDHHEFIIAVLHIIFYQPECWKPLAECIIESEEYALQKENLVRMLTGEFDDKYLCIIEQYTSIRMQELEVQRLRFIGNINGILLQKLPELIHQKFYDEDELIQQRQEPQPLIQHFEQWFQIMTSIPRNRPALSIVTTSYRDALDKLLLLRKGYLRYTPWCYRSYVWQLNEKLVRSITNVPSGRSYLLSVVERYAKDYERYESRHFFHFLLVSQRSSLRNCLNEELVEKPWFHDFLQKCCPEVIELLPEARIPFPDIQYNTPWKRDLRSIMQPSPMKGLKSRNQKQVLAWCLHFANNEREFWCYMAANKCLNDFLTKMDVESIRKDESLQITLFENLILAVSLSRKSLPELNQQIDDFVQLFSHIKEKHLSDLLFRLCQHLLKDDHTIPSVLPGMSLPLSQRQLAAIVKREYALMDGFIKVLHSQNSSQIYPNAIDDLMKFWKVDKVTAITFIIHLTQNALEHYESTGEFPHFLARFISALDEEDMDLFIQVLWDEGLLDEEFAKTMMAGFSVLRYPEMMRNLFEAIERNRDCVEIMQELHVQPTVVVIEML